MTDIMCINFYVSINDHLITVAQQMGSALINLHIHGFLWCFTNTVVIESENPVPLTPRPVSGQDPKPFPSTSDPHKLPPS
jgi:hypothetical protein